MFQETYCHPKYNEASPLLKQEKPKKLHVDLDQTILKKEIFISNLFELTHASIGQMEDVILLNFLPKLSDF